MISYGVRFRGHWTTAVKTGFARKTVLVRARKGEPIAEFTMPQEARYLEPEITEEILIYREKVTRMQAVRAIKRTNEARRRLALLVAHSTLAGESLPKIKTAARLMADSKLGPVKRRGKVWKICPLPPGDKKGLPATPAQVVVAANPGD